MALPDLSKLKSQLATSKVRETDTALFQLLNTLLDFLTRTTGEITGQITTVSGGSSTDLATLQARTYLTENDESSLLPNSRQLLAGDYITFDNSVVNELTVSGKKWSVLTDGDVIETELIYANGEVIMVHV